MPEPGKIQLLITFIPSTGECQVTFPPNLFVAQTMLAEAQYILTRERLLRERIARPAPGFTLPYPAATSAAVKLPDFLPPGAS